MVKTHPRLATERLRLRPFVADDAEPLAELGGERAIAETMPDWPHPFSLANARSTIAAQAASFQSGRSIHFAIERRDRPGLAGGIELYAIERVHRSAELRFWIATEEWGRGLASEAAVAALRFGFGELRLHRIGARPLARSESAAAVLSKVGMKQEGLLREATCQLGNFEDVALYGLLAADVPAALPDADQSW